MTGFFIKRKILNKIINILLTVSITYVIGKEVYYYKFQQKAKSGTQKYINNTSIASHINNDKQLENIETTFNYQAVISIPKLEIEQGFLDENSNNVDKNIALIYPSTLDNISNSSIVIAAHSGNSKKSYFHNLDNMQINDKVYIYYKGIKYVYSVINIFTIDKNGNLNIEDKASRLYLTTCSEEDSTQQLVIETKLVEQTIY